MVSVVMDCALLTPIAVGHESEVLATQPAVDYRTALLALFTALQIMLTAKSLAISDCGAWRTVAVCSVYEGGSQEFGVILYLVCEGHARRNMRQPRAVVRLAVAQSRTRSSPTNDDGRPLLRIASSAQSIPSTFFCSRNGCGMDEPRNINHYPVNWRERAWAPVHVAS
jgi:hypothetical protein